MRFKPFIIEYLQGTKFSNGIVVDIACSKEKNIDRLSFLEELVKGKKTIHLGCCDHLSLIEEKKSKDLWLHARLCRHSQKCIGIDLNNEGIEFLKNKLGYEDVFYLDITQPNKNIIHSSKWDYMILGEILEHVDNPCDFLYKINENYAGYVDSLVISVPNALSWQNIKYTFLNKEFINSDHRYWFTPYTLAKIVTLADMKVENFGFVNLFQMNNTNHFINLLISKNFLKIYFFKDTLLYNQH